MLAFEGLLFAAFPHAMGRAMRDASQMSEHVMRIVGVVSAVVGIVVLWAIKAL